MFDVGFPELIVIAIVALVVLGPERLPKAARFVGLWVRRARNQWDSVKNELERELAAEELKRNLQEAQEALRKTEQAMRESQTQAQNQLEQTRKEVLDVGSTGTHDPSTEMASTTTATSGTAQLTQTTSAAGQQHVTDKDPGDERPHVS